MCCICMWHADLISRICSMYSNCSACVVLNFDLMNSWDVAVCVRTALIEAEEQLTQADLICGDGDCGRVVKSGAERVRALLEGFAGNPDAATICHQSANAISASMGGTSGTHTGINVVGRVLVCVCVTEWDCWCVVRGMVRWIAHELKPAGALLEICLRAMATSLRTSGRDAVPAEAWSHALSSGVEAMQLCGGATVGMRTMMDALTPVAAAFTPSPADVAAVTVLARAARAKLDATRGAESTRDMPAVAGRSNYIDAKLMAGTADPGAQAVAVAFAALHDALAQLAQ